MLPVGKKRVIHFSLENAEKFGVEEIVIVVGFKAQNIIQNVGYEWGKIPIKYVWQEKLRGIVHAIQVSRKALENQDFILMLGDEVIGGFNHEAMLECFNSNVLGVIGVVKENSPEKIAETYPVVTNGGLVTYVEKGALIPNTNLKGTGNILLKPRIFKYIDRTTVNPKYKEKVLEDLLQTAINHGEKFAWAIVGNWYVNVNTWNDYAELSRKIGQ